jgi:four helix bundle protein
MRTVLNPNPVASELLVHVVMGFLFEKLDVYQRAVDLAEAVFKLTEELPRGQSALADQFKRAATSISLNIAEGNGRWHSKERKNFFLIARGSVFECVPLLELCRRRKGVADDYAKDLKGELDILAKMLSALIKGTDERREH